MKSRGRYDRERHSPEQGGSDRSPLIDFGDSVRNPVLAAYQRKLPEYAEVGDAESGDRGRLGAQAECSRHVHRRIGNGTREKVPRAFGRCNSTGVLGFQTRKAGAIS